MEWGVNPFQHLWINLEKPMWDDIYIYNPTQQIVVLATGFSKKHGTGLSFRILGDDSTILTSDYAGSHFQRTPRGQIDGFRFHVEDPRRHEMGG